MTFKDLLVRWALLAMILFALAMTYAFADRSWYAERFAPRYVPVTREAAAKEINDSCGRQPAWYAEASKCYATASSVDYALLRDRRKYEEKHLDPLLSVAEIVGIVVCFGFGAAALWNLWRWWRAQRYPAVTRARREAQMRMANALRIDKRLNSRRMEKANAEFLTLKNLLDNGLITEKDFLDRKGVLADSLVNEASRV
jgi:hypothetical protein